MQNIIHPAAGKWKGAMWRNSTHYSSLPLQQDPSLRYHVWLPCPPVYLVGLLHRTEPCAYTQVIANKKGFCMLVRLVFRLLYHSNEEFLARWSSSPGKRIKSEPMTAHMISLLCDSLVGLGTEAASLISQEKCYSNLRAAIDSHIEKHENSIFHLQESLSSPS